MSAGQTVALVAGAAILALMLGWFIGWTVREMGVRVAAEAFGFAAAVLAVGFAAGILIAYGVTGEWFS